MGVNIQFSQSYHWLSSWILANVIQLSVQDFCDRFVDYRMDPGRRLYDQMVMAARCGVANIAEGSARHSTSVETEMRLLDVARASFDELQGDLFNFLLRRNDDVWSIGNPDREAIWQLRLDEPKYSADYLHDAARHILAQKLKFSRWLDSDRAETVANALLILCLRENKNAASRCSGACRRKDNNKGASSGAAATTPAATASGPLTSNNRASRESRNYFRLTVK